MMYLIDFKGEAIINADDEEQARDFLSEDLDNIPMCNYEITNTKELD